MFLIVIGLMIHIGLANASTVEFYDNEALFEASHFSGSLEDFNDTTLSTGLTINADSSSYAISGGVMNDILSATDSTTFEFGSAINAFGGDFDLSPGGIGMGIELTMSFFLGSETVLTQQITDNGFFGFITDSTTLFNKVIFSLGNNYSAGLETYNLDNLRYGLHTPSEVPVPAAVWLFGSALMGLFGASRRKSTAVAA